jgi:hypothetical protein
MMQEDAERLLKRVFWLFLGAAFLLLLVYEVNSLLGNPFETMQLLFDINGGANIAAWYSSMQLFSIGIVFLCLRLVTGKCPGSGLFVALGIGFIYLSMDEAAVLHEKIAGTLEQVPWIPRFQEGRGIWITVYGLVGVWLTIAFKTSMVVVSRRFPRSAMIFTSGAGIFLLGGVVLEVCNYYHLFQTFYGMGPLLEEAAKLVGGSFMLLGAGNALLEYYYQ